MKISNENNGDSGTRVGAKPLRNHKDSTFCLLFSEPKRAIELYNAVTGENLPPDTKLEYTTLENALYIDRNNDLGFVIKDRHLVLTECQSTVNMNIPMRCLGYVSRTLENLTGKEGLYGKKVVKFPAPEFYVFHAGTGEWKEKQLRLSSSFLAKPKENSLELVVNLVNLNYTKGKEILERSPSLMGYSKLLFYIHEEMAANGGDLQGAINLAVKHCMEEGLITDFLQKHSREVTGMLFKEITVEEFAEIRAREAAEDAYVEGKKSGFAEGKKSGFTEGESVGMAKGVERGAAQKEREIAKGMLKEGMAKELIAKLTGLSLSEVAEL